MRIRTDCHGCNHIPRANLVEVRAALVWMLLTACEAPEPECRGEACARFPVLPLSDDEIGEPPPIADGWDDAPGSGAVFVVNSIYFAGGSRGDDLDGRCDADGCSDNVLWPLGSLGNDILRQGLLGGEPLILIEIVGLLPDYRGWDRSVTVKVYAAVDADDPPFAANNFKIPYGSSTCCEFRIDPTSLESGQARSRLAARIVDDRVETLERGAIEFRLGASTPPTPNFARAAASFDLPLSLTELNRGVITGVWLARSLAELPNPYCNPAGPRCYGPIPDPNLLELLSTLSVEMDIDLDDDGLECVLDRNGDGALDQCCASCTGTTCIGSMLPPIDPEVPVSCTGNLDDGFSATITITGVPATLR